MASLVKIISVLFIVLLLTQLFTISAFAAEGIPVGGCAPYFDIHPFMEHDGEHMHTHIGINEDINSDGFICMKIVSPTLHLHADNLFPLGD